MKVKLYRFRKRDNSTLQPSGNSWELSGNLRADCSISSPSIDFAIGPDDSPHEWNYAEIPIFGRFYWVRNWTYTGGLWTANLEVDVLATWRDDIGNSTQYILRASAARNGAVTDMLYPIVNQTSVITTTGENPFSQTLSGGLYVIGVVNNDPSGVGAVGYYVFNQAGFNAFKASLFNNIDWANLNFEGITSTNEGILKAQFNPFQYIVSCIWLPFFAGITNSFVGLLSYGWWTIDVSSVGVCGRLINNPVKTFTITVDIPKHPQQSRGSYLNNAPFSSYSLQLPYIGAVDIPATYIANATSITTSYTVDCLTGETNVDIGGFMRTTVNIATQIQLAQMAVNYLGAIENVSNAGAGIASSLLKFDVGGAIQNAVSGITGAITDSIPSMSTNGTNGSISGAYVTPRLVSTFRLVASEDNDNLGAPLCEPRQISSIPGYIMVADCDIDIPALAGETEQIKSYMNGGFFYE